MIISFVLKSDLLPCINTAFSFLSLISVDMHGISVSIFFLKEINPEYSLEGLMLKLKLQYFGHLMRKVNSLEKTLILGKFEGNRKSKRQRMRWLDGSLTQWT